jgi:hypothetical protein
MTPNAGCADPTSLFGGYLLKAGPLNPSRFGDIALIAFLMAQCLDGVFTYVGVMTYGLGIEANPIVAGLMVSLGHGPGLFGAKVLAGVLGICLHMRAIHRAVAVLATFYFAVAVGPWALILFL